MKILVACLVLVLLSASVHSQSENVKARYKKFINQHIDDRMSAEKCDQVIGKRRIKDTKTNACKDNNTFIRATTNLVKPICGSAGEPYDGGLTLSTKPFEIVVCKLKQARPPHCEYNGQSLRRRIAIACEEGFPVHYGKDIVYLDG